MGNVGPFTLPGFTWGAAGVWTLVAMVAVTLIKTWPIIAKQAIEARAKIRQERRDDLSDCQKRLDAMQTTVDGLTAAVNDLKINLNDAILAYRILDVELESHFPDSVALRQARSVMSTAFAVAPSSSLSPKEPK